MRATGTNTRPAPVSSPWWRLTNPAVYVIGLAPAVWTFYLAVNDQLGADPLKVLERSLGLWALRFLIAGLAITPLRRYASINLLRYRRALGLLAFIYAGLHLGVYLGLDQGLDASAIWKDLLKRPYITIGMLSFVVLVPLAATSSSYAIKRLGAAWQKLHRWVYLAAGAAAVHYLLLVKTWTAQPLAYAALVFALLLLRLLPRKSAKRTSGSKPAFERA